MTTHLLSITDLDASALRHLLDRARTFAQARSAQTRSAQDRHALATPTPGPLAGRSIGLLFEKPSTRTRVSFEVAVVELGGHPVVLSGSDTQLGRGESLEDTARTLSRYLHALVVRTFGQDRLDRLAVAGTIPIVNALSDLEHPCQAIADLQTIEDRLGHLAGVHLAFVGDGNNVAHSLLLAGALADMHVTVVTPPGYAPEPRIVAAATRLASLGHAQITVTEDLAAIEGADVVYTDVWASMGKEDEADARTAAFAAYQVNDALLRRAADAIVLHCLPAHRGEEITAEVFDQHANVIFQQAENRLHAQKAILEWLLP